MIEYNKEFWRGYMLTFSSRTEEHSCDVCGKPTEASRGTLLSKKIPVASWIDPSRPVGDNRRYAHEGCLAEKACRALRGPAPVADVVFPGLFGLTYRVSQPTPARLRQDHAIAQLIAEGVDRSSAVDLCKWEAGHEPKAVAEALARAAAPKPLRPMVDDVVEYKNPKCRIAGPMVIDSVVDDATVLVTLKWTGEHTIPLPISILRPVSRRTSTEIDLRGQEYEA